ncbi:MAG: hypothetical protein K2K83_02245 [Rikenella sp.]|nr:hypothetical protein [Rikenella sp.]
MRNKINKRFYAAWVALGVLLAVGSCARESSGMAGELARESFEAWVEKYAPEAYRNPYKDVYIEYIERGDEAVAAVPVMGYTWLEVGYTGRTLNRDVFVTRVDSISKRVGSFAYTTHFCDDFIEYSSSSTKLCEGLRQAFERMREGDSVRVYVPLDKGYTSAMNVNSGYQGESGVTYTSLPIVFEMRLKRVVSSPFIWERDSVQRYAERNWAGDEYWRDTVGMYARIVKQNPEGDPIGEDTLVAVYYEEYFMDGFLAATNIDTVAAKWNVYSSESSYDPVYVTPSSAANISENNVLYIVLPRMRKGEVAEVVTVSTWAHGDSGNASSTPEILPYQPMRYLIYASDGEEDKDEDEDDA